MLLGVVSKFLTTAEPSVNREVLPIQKAELIVIILFYFNSFCFVLGFPHSSIGKESACNVRKPSSIPGLGRPTGEVIGY